MPITNSSSLVWRDYVSDGDSGSGNHPPVKSDIRTWGGKVELRINEFATLKDYDATGDGATDDITEIEAADASAYEVLQVSDGTYITSAAVTTLSKRFEGPGHLRVAGQHRGRFFSFIDAAQTPATATSWTDQFDGDNSHSPIQIDVQYEDDVSNPFGAAGSVYVYRPEIIPVFAQLRIGTDVGFNSTTTQNGPGRTGAVLFRAKVSHTGQGDGVCYNATAFVDSTRGSSTHFLANPAIVLFNGDMQAGVAGAYLNCTEFAMTDAGFDAAAIGVVYNMTRSVDTGAKEAGWDGVRIQSKGTKEIDAGFRLTGKVDVAVDLSRIDSTSKAAIAIAADDRIYFNASQSGSTTFGTSLSTTYIVFDTVATNGIVMHVEGTSVLKITNDDCTLLEAGGRYIIGSNEVLGARITGWTAPTGTAQRGTWLTSTPPSNELLAQTLKALIDDLITHGMIGA